jgi:hypothetical protein
MATRQRYEATKWRDAMQGAPSYIASYASLLHAYGPD